MPPVHVNLTPTAYAILGLLRERPMHGYEIARHFKPEEELGQVVPADMSTIYTFLKDLQEHGLIYGERVTVGARPPRTVFSLTAEAEVPAPARIITSFVPAFNNDAGTIFCARTQPVYWNFIV